MTPALRLGAAGVVALALLVVVALASRGGLGGAGGGDGTPSSTLLDYAFSVFLVAYVAAVPFAVWAYVVRGRERRVRGAAGGRRGPGLLAQLVVFVLVVGLVATILAQHRARGTQTLLPQPPPAGSLSKRPAKAAHEREPQFRWSVVFVLAGLGVVGAAVVAVRRRRGRDEPRAALAAELGAALDDAIDDVRAETDPRRAVIKAYARLEAILAAHGLPRREAEAPYEYLSRALGRVVASARGVERLTGLYEEARFSRHAIEPSMRTEAIAALEATRDELRAAAA